MSGAATEPDLDKALEWIPKSRPKKIEPLFSYFFSPLQLKIQLKYHPSRYTSIFPLLCCRFFCLATCDDSAEMLCWVILNILGGTRGLYISIKFKIPHVLQNSNDFKFSGNPGNRPLTSLAAL